LLLEGDDGALIESVIIPTQKGRSRARATLCVSSQAGCARACTFCETGALGLRRQLHASEIIDQLRIAKKICADPAAPRDCRTREMVPTTISNIVFMGMGEPFDNLATVTRAINLVCDEHGFRWSASRITVSTVGVADRFAQFFSSTRAELAVSLNAPDDARRNRIMPINERFCMATLKTALLASLPPKRRVLFQYALFRDFNDSVEDADRLADYVTPIPCRINVIPANPGPDPTLQAPTQTAVDAFVHRLHRRGILTLVREPRGRDIGGACGQLAGSRRTAFVPLAAPRSRVR